MYLVEMVREVVVGVLKGSRRRSDASFNLVGCRSYKDSQKWWHHGEVQGESLWPPRILGWGQTDGHGCQKYWNVLVFIFKNLQFSKQLLWILNRSDLKPLPEDVFSGWKERSGEGKSLHFTPFSSTFQYNIQHDLNVFPIKTLGKFWSVTATEGQITTHLFHQIKILAFRV